MRIGDPLALPALEFTQSFKVGKIRHLLRAATTTRVVALADARISPRKTALLLTLDSGERVLCVDKKPPEIPAEADGVLIQRIDGFVWGWHKSLEVFEAAWKASPAAIRGTTRRGWAESFRLVNPVVKDTGSDDKRLRGPQAGALCAIAAHWSLSAAPATIVMPTGTGKTETILAAFVGCMSGTTLVAVPSRSLRDQTVRKFLGLGLLRELGVVAVQTANPIVGIIEHQPKTADDLAFLANCDVVVSVINSIAQGSAVELGPTLASTCDALVLDEAHHVAADSWTGLRDQFVGKRVLQFTATPFRRDGEPVDGRVVYNYPLRKAQEDGYFTKIHFHAILESDRDDADRIVASTAIAQLRADLKAGYDHLLMARCESIERAEKLQALYAGLAADLAPVVVHSEKPNAPALLDGILRRTNRIVVCVDMLGEGFDLPQLKVAAIHDTHKSLAVLLQFAGRFTRTSGSKLGEASVFANVADQKVTAALERLYSEDADWNGLLAEFSSDAVNEHIELVEFLKDTERLDPPEDDDPTYGLTSKSLRPKFSTVVFECDEFHPKRFKNAIDNRDELAGVWMNAKAGVLAFIRRYEPPVKWARAKAVRDVIWDLVVVFYDKSSKLLFVASSDHDTSYIDLARAVGNANVKHVSGDRMFRSLGHITRLVFQNVGLKKYGGRRALSFSMYSGTDVATALSPQQRAVSTKSNVSGSGFEHGQPTTIGCSYKGRVWSRDQGHLTEFIRWARAIGEKLNDASISTEDVIEHVMVPRAVIEFPDKTVLCLDWPRELLDRSDERVQLEANNEAFPLSQFSPEFTSVAGDRRTLTFGIVRDDIRSTYEYALGDSSYVIRHIAGPRLTIARGKTNVFLEEWLNDCPPSVLYVDGAELEGYAIVEPKESTVQPVPAAQIAVWDWTGVDLTKESIWKGGARRDDSIQAKSFSQLAAEGFDIIMDDDGSGEAADLVCLVEKPDHIRLVLAHCKYSGGADAGQRIKDVVEVASQAIRSSRWVWRFDHLCTHLQNRESYRLKKGGATRFLQGDMKALKRFAGLARIKEVRPEIVVIQPGLSKASMSADQSLILSGANGFLLDTVRTTLRVVSSP